MAFKWKCTKIKLHRNPWWVIAKVKEPVLGEKAAILLEWAAGIQVCEWEIRWFMACKHLSLNPSFLTIFYLAHKLIVELDFFPTNLQYLRRIVTILKLWKFDLDWNDVIF